MTGGRVQFLMPAILLGESSLATGTIRHVPVAQREAGSCQRGKLSLPLASHAGRSQLRFVAALHADRSLIAA